MTKKGKPTPRIETMRLYIFKKDILTSNQRKHRMYVAQKTAILRDIARTKAEMCLTPRNKPVTMTVTITNLKKGRFDPPNVYPTIKALIDGIVDAGIIEDDDSEHITALTFKRGSDYLRDHYTIEISIADH